MIRFVVRSDSHGAYGAWDCYLQRFEAVGLSEYDAEIDADRANADVRQQDSDNPPNQMTDN